MDVLTIQQAGIRGLPDPDVFAWAAEEGRILLTHDAKTMTGPAYARVAEGLPMPGLVVIAQSVPIRDAVEALMLFDGASVEGEWEGQIVRLPI